VQDFAIGIARGLVQQYEHLQIKKAHAKTQRRKAKKQRKRPVAAAAYLFLLLLCFLALRLCVFA
jgi:hypothetical protein